MARDLLGSPTMRCSPATDEKPSNFGVIAAESRVSNAAETAREPSAAHRVFPRCDAIQGDGTSSTIKHAVQPFTKVLCAEPFTIRTKVDPACSSPSCTITGDTNLVDKITARTADGRLHLMMPQGLSYRPTRPIVVELVLPRLGGKELRAGASAETSAIPGEDSGLSLLAAAPAPAPQPS